MTALRPDIYIAAMGRSGSTMLCNMLTEEPGQIVFIEPKFHTPPYRNMLVPQLAKYGMELAGPGPKNLAAPEMLDHLLGAHLRPIKWGFKEVLCSEHRKVIDAFTPHHILLSVRHIFNIALSFFEKHQRQGNEDRFPPSWVVDYCVRESEGLVRFCQDLKAKNTAFSVVKYEEFMQNPQIRQALSAKIGWQIKPSEDRFLAEFNRSFEAKRHKSAEFSETPLKDRNLSDDMINLARDIEAKCSKYQQFFGYAVS